MKIYTRTGDRGDTGLSDGSRVGKDTLRVECYGEVDELNACLGVVRAQHEDAGLDTLLAQIQKDLFALQQKLGLAMKRNQDLEAELEKLERSSKR